MDGNFVVKLNDLGNKNICLMKNCLAKKKII